MDENTIVKPVSITQTADQPLHQDQKRNLLTIVLIIILIIGASLMSFYFGRQQANKAQNNFESLAPTSKIPTTAIPTTPTLTQTLESDWKTHKTSFMSFSYPPDQVLEERQKGFFVILKDPADPMNSSVSIDTRSNEDRTSFNDYVTYTKSMLVSPTEEQIKNGVIITGKAGPGPHEGSTVRFAIFGRVDNRIFTIDAPLNANQQQLELFEQIVSTVTYNE